jgi:hypothetical protein
LWRTIHGAAARTAAAVLRLLGRPRVFEIKPAAPSRRNAFNNRHTWRSLRRKSCAYRQPTTIDVAQQRETPQLPGVVDRPGKRPSDPRAGLCSSLLHPHRRKDCVGRST